jgi:hypothetical protein
MPFASINPTNPRTNPWKFGGNCSAFDGGWKIQFFASFPWKLVNIYRIARIGQNIDDYPGFQQIPGMPILLQHSVYLLKTVSKWMSLYKRPLYDLFWPYFCHMYVYLSQNWGSDGHFEVLNMSYLWLVQKLGHKTQIFPFLFLWDFVQKQMFASSAFFAFLCFLS